MSRELNNCWTLLSTYTKFHLQERGSRRETIIYRKQYNIGGNTKADGTSALKTFVINKIRYVALRGIYWLMIYVDISFSALNSHHCTNEMFFYIHLMRLKNLHNVHRALKIYAGEKNILFIIIDKLLKFVIKWKKKNVN